MSRVFCSTAAKYGNTPHNWPISCKSSLTSVRVTSSYLLTSQDFQRWSSDPSKEDSNMDKVAAEMEMDRPRFMQSIRHLSHKSLFNASQKGENGPLYHQAPQDIIIMLITLIWNLNIILFSLKVSCFIILDYTGPETSFIIDPPFTFKGQNTVAFWFFKDSSILVKPRS